jgi:hypothetical protein
MRDNKPNALDTQIGGDHYKYMKIQPIEYSMANNMNACQHTAIKYVTRYKTKSGRLDLEKAIHCIQMLIELEYGTSKDPVQLDLFDGVPK